ncbi:protein sidekick-2-like isoform X2 [Orbicella faveolata]|uniref:protein sidekick-2-like isoform X2 n=1 Tax=Orbicella faveolata TaxID=48498 RepID=UPI0009E5F063|nr:protein sidekick-2-like isoform X2 [Orbicella faveolata]
MYDLVIKEVSIESRCESTGGFKSVNIIWKPLHKDFSNLTTYRVSYCTRGSTCVGQYQLGCTLNTSDSLQKELLQCSIIAKDLFPFQFYFKVEIQSSDGVHFISKTKACRLLTNTRCTIPQNLTATATGKKALSVTWKPPLFMGQLASYLCFKILYAPAHAKKNEILEFSTNTFHHTISDLSPYTAYTLYIQCGFADCVGGWGLLSRPVTVRTNEEAPAKAPEFRNWSISKTSRDKRDVTVVWKLPPPNTWNGVPNGFNLDFWQLSLGENGSLTPLPNSSRHLHVGDGNATKATLQGLSLFAYYQTQISMCTAEGCGPSSEPFAFPGERKPSTTPTHQPSDNIVFIWAGIVVGPIVLVAVPIGLICAWRNRQDRYVEYFDISYK